MQGDDGGRGREVGFAVLVLTAPIFSIFKPGMYL
jgi:hypothetical protein